MIVAIKQISFIVWNLHISYISLLNQAGKTLGAIFVGILLRDSVRDFGVEFESSCHREILEISSRAVKKL